MKNWKPDCISKDYGGHCQAVHFPLTTASAGTVNGLCLTPEGGAVTVFTLFMVHFPRGPHLCMNRLFFFKGNSFLHGLKGILVYPAMHSTITLTQISAHKSTHRAVPHMMRKLLLPLLSQTLNRL